MIVQNVSSSTVPVASSLPVTNPSPSTAKPAVPDPAPVANVSVDTPADHANLSEDTLRTTLAVANEKLSRTGSALHFSVDNETNRPVVTVTDKDTGVVIRQFPTDEALAIARSIDEMLKQFSPSIGPGTLYKQSA